MEEATFPRLLISSSRIILGGEKFWDVGSPRGFSGKSKAMAIIEGMVAIR